jgi:hypothetical protein
LQSSARDSTLARILLWGTRMIETISKRVNADTGLIRRGRFVTTAFVIAVGNTYHTVRIENGRVEKIISEPFLGSDHTFMLWAPQEVWAKFWQPVPPPGFNDIFALTKQNLMRIEGNLYQFMSNLLYFKDVIAAPRKGAMP